MNNNLGMMLMKSFLTQGDIRWVVGDLKWMLSTPTVTKMDRVTRIMVKRRYLPSKGTAKDVGGIISARSKKKTVNDSRIEIHRVTYMTINPIE